jgi:hypothetical protein
MKLRFLVACAIAGIVGFGLFEAQAEGTSSMPSQHLQYSRPAGDIRLAQGKNEPACQQECAKTRRMCTGDYPKPEEFRQCEAAESACKAKC